MRASDRTCRNFRQQMVEALLVSAASGQLPPTLAGHVAACRECAAHWRRLLAASRLFAPESAYGPRLRARTLARVAGDRASVGRPVAVVHACRAGQHGRGVRRPDGALSALTTVLDSSRLATVAALLIVGSLFVLLPAGLAVSLIRRAPEVNGAARLEEKGVMS
jgi:hypothetical protein